MRFLSYALVSCLIVLGASAAYSEKGGVHVGGGGGGIFIDGQYYLSDLVEAGVHRAVVFGAGDRNHVLAFSAPLVHGGIEPSIAKLLAEKLTEVERYEPVLADALFQALTNLTWFQTDEPLVETTDHEDEIVKSHAVQLARRDGAVVRLYGPSVRLMPLDNQVALYMHEAMAALAPATLDHPHLRSVVAMLFSGRLHQAALNGQIQTLFALFPTMKFVARGSKRPTLTYQHEFYMSPAGPVMTPEVVYNPFIELKWTDLRSGIERFFFAETPEVANVDLFSGVNDVRPLMYCDLERRSLSLSELAFYVYKLRLKLPSSTRDENQPRFTVSLSLERRAFISFQPLLKRTQAACEPRQRQKIRSLIGWTDALQTIGVSEIH